MGNVDDGWTWVNATTATFAVTLTAASCDVVTPVAPTFTQAECVGGVLQPPTLTLADTDGITYTADPDGPYLLLPQLVTVTATLDDAGVAWPDPLEGGWTETGPTTATYPVMFVFKACTPVVPVEPVPTQASCTSGESRCRRSSWRPHRRGSPTWLTRPVPMTAR